VGEYCKFHVEDIQALEAGRMGDISKQVAVRELIAAYAEAIGLLPDDVLLRFEEAEGNFRASAQRSAAGRAGSPGRLRGGVWVWGAGALLVGAAAYAFASGRLAPFLK
jgi:hypothetical protein